MSEEREHMKWHAADQAALDRQDAADDRTDLGTKLSERIDALTEENEALHRLAQERLTELRVSHLVVDRLTRQIDRLTSETRPRAVLPHRGGMMPHIPRAVCLRCRREMRPHKNSAVGEAILPDHASYYKVDSDIWRCGRCGIEVAIGFAAEPLVEHHMPQYASVKSDYQFRFRDDPHPDRTHEDVHEHGDAVVSDEEEWDPHGIDAMNAEALSNYRGGLSE